MSDYAPAETPFQQLGGESFVRNLHQYVQSTEQQLAELRFHKSELERSVTQLEATVAVKDKIIKEYLRRVALLEFALKKERGYGLLGREEQGKKLFSNETSIVKAEAAVCPPPVVSTARRNVLPPVVEFKQSQTLGCSLLEVSSLSMSSGGFLLTGSNDSLIKLWSLSDANAFSATPTAVLRGGHAGTGIGALACEPCTNGQTAGVFAASGDNGGKIVVWDIDFEKIRNIDAYPSTSDLEKAASHRGVPNAHGTQPVTAIGFGKDSEVMASAGMDKTVKIWHLGKTHDSSVQKVCAFNELSDHATCLLWHPSEQSQLLAGFALGNLSLLDVVSNKIVCSPEFNSAIRNLARLNEGNIVVALQNGTITTVDFNSDKPPVIVTAESQPIVGMDASGYTVAAAYSDNFVKVFDIRRPESPVQTWKCPTENGNLTCIAVAESVIATGSDDGKVFVFSTR